MNLYIFLNYLFKYLKTNIIPFIRQFSRNNIFGKIYNKRINLNIDVRAIQNVLCYFVSGIFDVDSS